MLCLTYLIVRDGCKTISNIYDRVFLQKKWTAKANTLNGFRVL